MAGSPAKQRPQAVEHLDSWFKTARVTPAEMLGVML